MQSNMKEELFSKLTDDEKIDIAAEYILSRYLPAFAKLENDGHQIQEEE